ncbi:MAG: PAS domain-containing protein [Victivallaceae bacterium]|nr:PAS domain-containing protein [Victivallaceae bacterium]
MKKTDQSSQQQLKEIDILKAEIVELKASVARWSAVKLQPDNKQLIANQKPLPQTKGFAEILLETANVIIVTLDTDANIMLFNGFAEKLSGYTKQEVFGKNWFELFIPKRNGFVIPEVFQDVLSKMSEVSSYENHILCRDGSERLISWQNSVLKNEHGAISGVLSIGTDVTERRQTEAAIKESEKKASSIVESTPMGIHIYSLEVDGKLIFTGANPAADHLLGVDNSQFIGKNIEEAFPGLVNTEIPEIYREVASQGRKWQSEQVTYESGAISGAFEVYAFQTLPGKMVAMFQDISERKRLEAKLEKYRETLEEKVKVRTSELEDKNRELDKTLKVFVGRELMIKTLQEKINVLG